MKFVKLTQRIPGLSDYRDILLNVDTTSIQMIARNSDGKASIRVFKGSCFDWIDLAETPEQVRKIVDSTYQETYGSKIDQLKAQLKNQQDEIRKLKEEAARPAAPAKTVIRTERGWAGHYCSARECLFRRNTLLECGEQKIVISTVGNRMDERNVIQEIGHDRFYETFVFAAVCDGGYIEADITRQILIDAKCTIMRPELYLSKGMADAIADDMHENVVSLVSQLIESGENLIPEKGDCDVWK